MDKEYKVKRSEQTRFSFAEFKKMCWQMSAKDDYHFIDFCRIFDAELKALYNKTGLPVGQNLDQFSVPATNNIEEMAMELIIQNLPGRSDGELLQLQRSYHNWAGIRRNGELIPSFDAPYNSYPTEVFEHLVKLVDIEIQRRISNRAGGNDE